MVNDMMVVGTNIKNMEPETGDGTTAKLEMVNGEMTSVYVGQVKKCSAEKLDASRNNRI